MASVTFTVATGGDGSTVTDDSNPTTGLAAGGHRVRFVPALTQTVNTAAFTVTKAAEAAASAVDSAASAATALAAPGTNATSTTSIAIGTGSKVFTTQSGKSFVEGMNVMVASDAAPSTNAMFGVITAYSGTSLTVDVKQVNGSGTLADWIISITGPLNVGVFNEIKGTDIASASTINLDTATGNLVHVTGTTTITAITLSSGRERTVVFDGILTLTHGANLICPGSQDITTAAGDSMIVRGDGSATRIISYTKVALVPGASSFTKTTRTSNVILAASDRGTIINITSGTFTQTFTAAATLGSGWYVWLKNSGTGDITLDPNSTETVDGLTSYIMYPGECRLIHCDGTLFTSIVLCGFSKSFTSTGTFVKPPGYNNFEFELWNGGCSGAKSDATTLSSGGGGGGYFFGVLPASKFSASETITVGAGGAAVASALTNGNIGGLSSIGALIVMTAANSFRSGSSITGLATNGTDFGHQNSSNTPSTTPRYLYGGTASSDLGSAPSGNANFGGAAGGSVDGPGTLYSPGTSLLGGNGGIASTTGPGTAGSIPGGGGGATKTGANSGAGARGEVRIWGDV